MGFSVSGSAAILFAGLFIAFGMYHTAATNSFERVDEARNDRLDDALDQENTAIDVVNATFDSGVLSVEATNNGSTALSVNATDLVVDNEYRTGWRSSATVAGNGGTDLWLPGETLSVSISLLSTPDRVKVVTENGVADVREVTA